MENKIESHEKEDGQQFKLIKDGQTVITEGMEQIQGTIHAYIETVRSDIKDMVADMHRENREKMELLLRIIEKQEK